MHSVILCLFAILSCLLAPAVSAEVYKWTDAEGRVHFGDRPPGRDAESVTIRGAGKDDANDYQAPVTPADRAAKQRRLLNAFEEERRQKQEQKDEARNKKMERQRSCAKARDELEGLLTHGRIYNLDKDGNRVYLDGPGRDRAIADARREVEHRCGK